MGRDKDTYFIPSWTICPYFDELVVEVVGGFGDVGAIEL